MSKNSKHEMQASQDDTAVAVAPDANEELLNEDDTGEESADVVDDMDQQESLST